MAGVLPQLERANAAFVTPNLAVGGDLDPTLFRALDQLDELVEAGVTHIIDVRCETSDAELVARFAPDVVYLHHGVDDAGQPIPFEWFEEAASWALDALAAGSSVLVHCHMGINRAPSLGFAIMLGLGWDPIAALDAIRGVRPIAAVAYAADAVAWHHQRTGGTTAQLRRTLRRLAAWRETNDVDLAEVLRLRGEERAVPTWDVLRRHPGAVLFLFSRAGQLQEPIDRDYEWFDEPSAREEYFRDTVEWAEEWLEGQDGLAITVINVADTAAMVIDDVVVVGADVADSARAEWVAALRADPSRVAEPNPTGRSEVPHGTTSIAIPSAVETVGRSSEGKGHSVDQLWILEPGADVDLESIDHGLEPGTAVFVAVRSSRAGLLLVSLGFVAGDEEDEADRIGEVHFDWPIPDGLGIPLDGIEIPPHDERADIAQIPIPEELSDRLLERWNANEWVTAFGAMLEEPRGAWLMLGAEPNAQYLAENHEKLFFPTLDDIWTAPKQVQPGDLLFFYFMDPIQAVRFVGRAASYPFFADDIEVEGGGKAGNRQWWVHIGMVMPIQPIPLGAIRDAFDGHLVLRGRPRYLPPAVIERLLPLVDAEAVEAGLVAVPTGLADLPNPRDIGVDGWPTIASGALTLERHVEDYLVEPLLRLAFADRPEMTWTRQHRTPRRGAVDFAAWRGSELAAAIEVKLGTRFRETGAHAGSPDFGQLRRYMEELHVPGMLIDANRLFLFRRGDEWPTRVLERASMTATDFETVAAHLGVLVP